MPLAYLHLHGLQRALIIHQVQPRDVAHLQGSRPSRQDLVGLRTGSQRHAGSKAMQLGSVSAGHLSRRPLPHLSATDAFLQCLLSFCLAAPGSSPPCPASSSPATAATAPRLQRQHCCRCGSRTPHFIALVCFAAAPPTVELASNTEGFWKVKVATPEDPSLLRVSLTSGMVGSLMPWMNCSEVLASTCSRPAAAGRRAAALLRAAKAGAAGRAAGRQGTSRELLKGLR